MTIFTSGFESLNYPQQSITERMLAGLAGRENEPAFIDGPSGRVMTGTQLRDMIERLAGGLAGRGLGAGHVIAIMAPNMPEYAAVFHAIAWGGGTVTTVNPSYTADEVNYQLKDSRAELLVTVPAFLETARAAIAGTNVTDIAVIGGADGALALSDLLGEPLRAQVPVDLNEHVLALPYSSGTTGLPKGVMLSHSNLVANLEQIGAVIGLSPGDRTVAFLPFFHIYGLEIFVNFYPAFGAVPVTMPRFDLELFLRLTVEHRVRRLYVVPPVIIALTRHPLVDGHDLSGVETILSAAAPMGAEVGKACAGRLGCEVVQGYGMTELSPVTNLIPPGCARPGSAGVLVPDTECRVVDPETGAECGVGEEGELLYRGPQVMIGYLDRPEATAQTIDGDGWLHTGDLGYVDADGYMFIVDRVKELIKFKGFQVAPAELEALLLAHDAVSDAAVIGRADDEAGEVPVAFVVCAEAAQPSLADLQEFLTGHVASYKVIQDVTFLEAIPKSPSGKILRRMLRDSA